MTRDSQDDELAAVIPLHGRRDADLRARLREALADRGSITQDLGPGDVTAKVWRATARRAAKDLSRPVRTGEVPSDTHDQVPDEVAVTTVWAALNDWPATDAERATLEVSQRRITDAVAADLHALLGQAPAAE